MPVDTFMNVFINQDWTFKSFCDGSHDKTFFFFFFFNVTKDLYRPVEMLHARFSHPCSEPHRLWSFPTGRRWWGGRPWLAPRFSYPSLPSSAGPLSSVRRRRGQSLGGSSEEDSMFRTAQRQKHSLQKTWAPFIWGVNRRDRRCSTGGSQPKVGHRAILIGPRLRGRFFNFSECCGINEYCDFMIRKICGCWDST